MIPIPGARAVLDRADSVMNGLDSLVLMEELTDGVNTVSTRYAFVAPDRMHYRVSNGSELIVLGTVVYRRLTADGPWTREDWPLGEGFRWPRFAWAATAEEVEVVGAEAVRGNETWVVTFRDAESDARFRLWVGVDDGRVHRLRMIATAHYMTWELLAFNAPVRIEPPTD